MKRLLANPSMSGYTLLQKEEQVIQFLHVNAAQLSPTLRSAAFFPGKSWNEIFALLLSALFALIDAQLLPQVERIIGDQIGFAFVPFIRQQNVSEEQVRDQVKVNVLKLIRSPNLRRGFTGPLTALEHRLSGRYVDEVFRRKGYIHFELTKVQRLRMSKEEVRQLVDVSILLRPLIGLLAVEDGSAGADRGTGLIAAAHAERAVEIAKKSFPLMPVPVLQSALNAGVSFQENRFVEATARLAGVFSSRARSYHPNVRVDRGADSPDKSWLSIARRNYKHFGFDIKLLDELYKIAAENGW